MKSADSLSFCFIACDNGLGHVRRVVTVANELAGQGARVTVLARTDQAGRFGWPAQHFETGTSVEALRRGDKNACLWHERLPDLDGYDVVVSDNLPEVLLVREDAVLMGSFLWHLVVEGADAAYLEASQQLVSSRRPAMIGAGLFASPELKAITRYRDVGLFRTAEIPRGDKTDLLVACGRSGSGEEEAAAGVQLLMAMGPGPFQAVHVEPRLLGDSHPPWMRPADFSTWMYSRVAAAIIRPGVGTVTEALQAGCDIYCFYERGNGEMAFNASQIASHGFGFDCGGIDAALQQALNRGTERRLSLEAPRRLRFDGAQRAARHLLAHAAT